MPPVCVTAWTKSWRFKRCERGCCDRRQPLTWSHFNDFTGFPSPIITAVIGRCGVLGVFTSYMEQITRSCRIVVELMEREMGFAFDDREQRRHRVRVFTKGK